MTVIVTYARHFQDIADLLPSLAADELLNRLGKDYLCDLD